VRFGKKITASFICLFFVGCLAPTLANAGAPPSTQWASSATAENWSFEPDETWGPTQVTGAPDADGCDSSNVWSQAVEEGVTSITLSYENAVVPDAINVYQNNVIGAVSLIEVSADQTTWTTVYTGNPQLASEGTCLEANQYDDILSAPVTNVHSQISYVRITVDGTATPNWIEIDAVQLVGSETLPEPTTTTTVAPTVATTTTLVTNLPATGSGSSSTALLSLMLILSGVLVVSGLRRRLI
jgi:LPXTG-motif cell wall-anchored protein